MGLGDGLVEPNLFCDQVECGGVEVLRQPFPGLAPQGNRRHHAVDPGECHAAKNERHDGAWEIVTLGQPAGRDDAGVTGLRQRVGQRVAADRIDHRAPALLLQGLARSGELGPIDDLAGAELLQVGGRLGFAAGRGDAIAVPLEREDTEHGCVARRADGHRLPGGERRREPDQPVTLQTRPLGEAAPARFTDAPAVVDDDVARLPVSMRRFEHATGAVDSGDHRPDANDGAAIGDGQRVLEVERGMRDGHFDIADRQRGLFQRPDSGAKASIILFEQQSLEHFVISEPSALGGRLFVNDSAATGPPGRRPARRDGAAVDRGPANRLSCAPMLVPLPSPDRRLRSLAGAILLALSAGAAHAAPEEPADPVMKLLADKGLVAETPGAALVERAEAPGPSLMRTVRDKASEMTLTALNFVGVPYRRGGTTAESGFDCSGFTRHVFEMSLGLVLPRRADDQARAPGLAPVQREDLQPGDLVFFNTMRRTFSHVGIYIGDDRFIHAPSHGKDVRTDSLTLTYWAKRFTGGRRADLPADSSSAAAEPAALAAFR